MLGEGFDSFLASLSQQEAGPVERFAEAVAARVVAAGAGAGEAIPVLLAFKPVCMAALQEEGWRASALVTASEKLDQVAGWAVARFGERYAALVESVLAAQVHRLRESEERLLSQTAELERQRQQSEQRTREIAALNRSAMALNSTLELDEVSRLIVEQASELVGTGPCALYQWDGEAGRLRALAATGIGREVTERIAAAVSMEPRAVRRVLQERRPLAIANMGEATGLLPSEALAAAREQGIRASLAAPLVAHDQLLGYLATYYLAPRSFADHEIALLSAFAEYAAAALENARLYARARGLAALEERNRIAREIHDTLAQDLSGLVLQLQGVGRYLDRDQAVAREELKEAIRIARSALQEARRSVWELRARPLEELSLVEAIQAEAARLEAEGIRVEFHQEGEPVPVGAEAEHNLYRIAQEALANVRRHSRARQVAVALRFSPGSVELAVEDDGVGFSQEEGLGAETGHFGLLGMRDRVRLLGGSLTVESTPGEGTRICTRIPVTRGGG